MTLPSHVFAYDGLLADDEIVTSEAQENRVAPQVRLPASLSFFESSEVRGDRIWLSDLARCSGAARFCREMSTVDLGPAPQPGRTIRLLRETLESQIAEEWLDAELDFGGPRWIKVAAVSRALSDDEVLSALQSHLPDAGSKFRFVISRVQMIGPSLVRDGPGTIRFPELETPVDDEILAQKFLGPQTLRASWVPGGDGSAINFNVSVVVVPQVRRWVARTSLVAGRAVSPDDLVEAWLPLRRSDAHAEKSWIVGRVLRYSIQAGSPIPQNAATLPHLVRRGEYLQMSMGSDGFQVTSRVESLGQGQVGDVIDVQIPESRKRMRAKVIAKGLVEAL